MLSEIEKKFEGDVGKSDAHNRLQAKLDMISNTGMAGYFKRRNAKKSVANFNSLVIIYIFIMFLFIFSFFLGDGVFRIKG